MLPPVGRLILRFWIELPVGLVALLVFVFVGLETVLALFVVVLVTLLLVVFAGVLVTLLPVVVVLFF